MVNAVDSVTPATNDGVITITAPPNVIQSTNLADSIMSVCPRAAPDEDSTEHNETHKTVDLIRAILSKIQFLEERTNNLSAPVVSNSAKIPFQLPQGTLNNSEAGIGITN